MKVRAMFLGAAVFALTSSGCSKKEEGKGTSQAPARKATRPARQAARQGAARAGEGKQAKARPAPLKPMTNDKIGFEFMFPANGKLDNCHDDTCVYLASIPNEVFSLYVRVTTENKKKMSLGDAIREATLMGGKAIAEKKTLPDGSHLVVKVPTGAQQEVHYFKPGGPKVLWAYCRGPKSAIELIKKVCTSIKPKPKAGK